MNWWLEAAHVFHGCALSITRLQILVQNSNYFIIQNLELANSLNHFLQRLQTSKEQTAELALDMKSLSQKSCKCCYLSQQCYNCFPCTAKPVEIQGAFWFLTVLLWVQRSSIQGSLVIMGMNIYEMEGIKNISYICDIRILLDQSSDSSLNALIFGFWKSWCPHFQQFILKKALPHLRCIWVQTALSCSCLHHYSKNRCFQLTTFLITSSLPSCFWTFNRW